MIQHEYKIITHNVIQYIMMYCIILFYFMPYYPVLNETASYYIIEYSIMLYCITLYTTVLYYVILYVILYHIILYYTIL